jgi:NADH-quinone oxidoreductase subunit E
MTQPAELAAATVDLAQVEAAMDRCGRRPSALIAVLQELQEQFQYLPREALERVAEGLGVPFIQVYGVATFYTAFSLRPRGRHYLRVCAGTACHVRGADLLLDQLERDLGIPDGETTPDGLFTVESVNCLGACALGPVVVLDGVYYHHMTPGKLTKVLRSVAKADAEATADA